jgi:hypothetical protein
MGLRPAMDRQMPELEAGTSRVPREARLSDAPTSKALCACGALVEIDRSVLKTKKALGKPVECRRCRNERVARDLEGPEGEEIL